MNIAFFTLFPIHPYTGGIERVTSNLSSYFITRGIGVYYFCINGEENENHFILPKNNEKKNIIEYIKNKVREFKIDIIIDQYGTSEYFSHKELGREVKIIRCVHTNIVENHITACLLGNFSFSRLKYSLINFLFWLNTPLRRLKMKSSFKKIKDIDKLVVLSKSYVDCLKKYYRKESDKVTYIYNSIPDHDVNTLPQKDNIILYCGRIVHNPKNIKFLLSLWDTLYEKHSDWSFIFCGDGIDRVMVEAYMRKHPTSRIKITGYTDPTEYYQRAKILVLPSFSEGFGMVLLEGMSYGCVPVVFDSTPVFHEIIPSHTGYIVKDQHEKEYINICDNLMSDNENIILRGQNSLEYVKENFLMDKIGNAWIKLFKELSKKE